MIAAPQLLLHLDAADAHYAPGQRLSGHFLIESPLPWAVKAAELSILWYTAGQGDEDFAVLHFERFVDDAARPLDLRVPQRFAGLLPPSPLSYDGQVVKVCWCVRLRVFPQNGPEVVQEMAFRLGAIPPPPAAS